MSKTLKQDISHAVGIDGSAECCKVLNFFLRQYYTQIDFIMFFVWFFLVMSTNGILGSYVSASCLLWCAEAAG